MMIGMKRIARIGERAHGGAEDAADDSTPSTTGKVADHYDGHGAERDTEPIHVAEQVAAVELVRGA